MLQANLAQEIQRTARAYGNSARDLEEHSDTWKVTPADLCH
jgi:hypothetical protein